MINLILSLRAVDEENSLQLFLKQSQIVNSPRIINHFIVWMIRPKGCHTGVLVACGLELTTPLGHPYETLHLQQLFLLVQTVKMRTGKLSTLLSAVLLGLLPPVEMIMKN